MTQYTTNSPMFLGLCGAAGSGKTSVANAMVPQYQALETNDFIIDHKFLAMPLYEMAAIRRKTQGEKSKDRILYLLHDSLSELFGRSPLYGAPSYSDLVQLTQDIANLPIVMDEDVKPRTFLQTAGMMCREIDEDCFVKWIDRSAKRDSLAAIADDKTYVCVVSDVRMPNEAKFISEHPNGFLIKFAVSPKVQAERLQKRDGFVMTPEQASHVSERIDLIPEEYIAVTIDSDGYTVSQQANLTQKVLSAQLNDSAPAIDATLTNKELHNAQAS